MLRALLFFVLFVTAARLEAAPTAAPSLADALARAHAQLEAGDRAAARKELTSALRSFPSHPVVHNFLGVVEAQDGNYRAAQTRFRQAVRLAPRFTEAYLNLGRLYQENAANDPDAAREALAAYEAVLAYDPGHAESLYQSAVLLQATGAFARSLARLSRLPEDHRQQAQVLALRCADEVGVGNGVEADRLADALQVHPELVELDVVSILPALFAHGREDLALRLLERLRARGLASADGLQRLGAAHEAAGRLEQAREALEAAARAHPEVVDLLLDLARVAHKARDGRGALGYLAHARGLAPNDARIHFFFGMVCVDLDLGVEAFNSLKEAVRLEPGNAAFNYAAGSVSLHRRDPTDAVPFFRKYSELKPDDPRGPLALGMALFKAGDFGSAQPQLLRAANSTSTTAAASYFLARIAREENDAARALGLVDKALAAQPDYADAWAERGLLDLRRKDFEQAEKDLARCLALDPDNYLGNLHLLALFQRIKDPRLDVQSRRLEELKAVREEKAEEFRRVIDVRPY